MVTAQGMTMVGVVMLFVLATLSPQYVVAWGKEGHALVGDLAQEFLLPKTRSIVLQLLGNKTLGQVANYADAIKKHHGYDPRFDQLHYADTHDNPPYTCSYTPSVDCPDQWCVVSAIRNITGDLEQTTSSSSYPRRYPFGRSRFRINNKHKQHAHSFEFSDIDQQITPTRTASSFVDAHSNIGRDPSEKLKFLVHFVGDIHQPLHVCGKEKGGNGFHVYLDGKLSNLHGVWDYGLIQKRLRHDFGGSLQLYRNYLLQVVNKAVESSMNNDNVEAVKNPLEDLDPARWAVETNAYNCRYVWADIVEYSELDETYYRKNIQLIENLILKAGLRLANTLNSLFSQ